MVQQTASAFMGGIGKKNKKEKKPSKELRGLNQIKFN